MTAHPVLPTLPIKCSRIRVSPKTRWPSQVLSQCVLSWYGQKTTMTCFYFLLFGPRYLGVADLYLVACTLRKIKSMQKGHGRWTGSDESEWTCKNTESTVRERLYLVKEKFPTTNGPSEHSSVLKTRHEHWRDSLVYWSVTFIVTETSSRPQSQNLSMLRSRAEIS